MMESFQIWSMVGAGSAALLVIALLLWIQRRLLYICAPNEILIFSGRRHTTAAGRQLGFRVLTGGRAIRLPVVERVERMDVSLIAVPMTVSGAYSQGGIPLVVQAIANVKVSTDPAVMTNAVERFLGRGTAEIARVSKETLEGHLRGVIANMTPEDVNEDRLAFAGQLAAEAGEDLRKLGLQLDTLKIQNVSDDRSYLDSLGRSRVAEVVREAEVAESDALRAAEEAEARCKARGEVATMRARAAIGQKQNDLRRQVAELGARAAGEEQRALAAGAAARAEAEQGLQRVRGELETLRLAADVTIPAEAERRARELEAAGDAAHVAEQGKASAEALAILAGAWSRSNGKAMDVLVLQQLEPLLSTVAAAAARVKIEGASVIDAGDGKAVAAYAAARPAAVEALLEVVARTTGVDVARIMKGGSQ